LHVGGVLDRGRRQRQRWDEIGGEGVMN